MKSINWVDILMVIFGLIIIGAGILVGYGVGQNIFEHTSGISTAQPIYQQKIGDDTEPDVLIIYEAKVDGVKVYPSVIKEVE